MLVAESSGLDRRLRRRDVFSEAWGKVLAGPDDELTRMEAPALAVRRDSVKVVRTQREGEAQYEAYDLSADPHESWNLTGRAETATITELRKVIDGYQAASRLARARLLGVDVGDLPDDEARAKWISPETQNKLRALGYVD
jgi:hypothetical protein